jgi:miniconductance mechanosensitive channel
MRQFLIDMALQSGLTDTWAHVIVTIVLLILLLLGVWVVWHIFRTWLRRFILSITEKTKTDLDDLLLNTRVLSAIGHLVPALIFNFFAPLVFADYPVLLPVAIGITDIFIIYVLTEIISSLLNAAGRLIQRMERFRDKPIASFIQLAKIIVYAVAAIFAISIAIDKEPLYLLSGLGAMAAILLLVFKDSILGFVASIQLSANDMVRVGDWVTVKKIWCRWRCY